MDNQDSLVCSNCGNVCYEGQTKCLLCGQTIKAIPILPEITSDNGKVIKRTRTKKEQPNSNELQTIIDELRSTKELLNKEIGHHKTKPGYTSIAAWICLILVLGMIYIVYKWVISQGGLPHEFYNLLRYLGILKS